MKNKKILIVIIVSIMTITSVGGSLAYFYSERVYNLGKRKTANFDVSYNHTYIAPDTFFPGDSADLNVYVTNNGKVPVMVRAKINETWVKGNNNISTILNNKEESVIKYINKDWYKIGDWYYYKNILNGEEVSSSLIDSILFNSNTEVIDACDTDNVSNNCVPTTIYTDAKYKIEVTFDVIQNGVSEEEWGLNVLEKPLLEEIKKNATYDDVISKNVEDKIDYDKVSSDTNGKGVYVLSDTISEGPIYFYRGDTLFNNVLISNNCFKIISTNSNGSIKLLYNGNYNDGVCDNNYSIGSSFYNKDSISKIMNNWITSINDKYIEGSYLLSVDDLKLVGVLYDEDNDTYLSGNDKYWVLNNYVLGNTLKIGEGSNHIRPVVIVSKDITFVSGDGSINDPYVVK